MQKITLPAITLIIFLSLFSCTRDKKIIQVRYAPVLFDLVAPDSIQRASPYIYYLFINAYDPDGYDNIDSVYFRVLRPDSTLNENIFSMRDDGQYGDSVAADSRFTLGIRAGDSTSQLGDYIFTFYARDKDGDESNHPAAIITEY
jgi:hypothetical protein